MKLNIDFVKAKFSIEKSTQRMGKIDKWHKHEFRFHAIVATLQVLQWHCYTLLKNFRVADGFNEVVHISAKRNSHRLKNYLKEGEANLTTWFTGIHSLVLHLETRILKNMNKYREMWWSGKESYFKTVESFPRGREY